MHVAQALDSHKGGMSPASVCRGYPKSRCLPGLVALWKSESVDLTVRSERVSFVKFQLEKLTVDL
jgi:hypothetical protein